jgi:hypothetical protein
MKIVIIASLDFTPEIKKIASQLVKQGHQVTIPKVSEMILNGQVSLKQIIREKESGQISKRAIKLDVIKYYFKKIKQADAVLVLNFDKKGVKNYIGGSALIEMAFAYVWGKKIFLLNEIPEMAYQAEIKAMQPVVIHSDLLKVE